MVNVGTNVNIYVVYEIQMYYVLMYGLIQGPCVCTDRDRGLPLMYELVDFLNGEPYLYCYTMMRKLSFIITKTALY